ncbi:OmpH family outer membrane protein [Gallaecimonas sp. GXIMD1310]|uniref:OmpH family outer membrane protein n=1 Tax=Gallaecimonas sp. GXIMD1310 TaxID=3131926 RepID=UPI0032471085
MKKSLIGAGLAVAMTAAVAMPASAEVRIAVVDMAKVFQSMPQRADLEKNMKAQFSDRIEAVRKIEKKMQDLQDKARRNASIMTDDQKTDLGRQMEQLRAEYQLKRKALDEDVGSARQKERDQLLNMIDKAVNTVSKGKYDIVLQRGAVVYTSSNVDISDKVIAQVSKEK